MFDEVFSSGNNEPVVVKIGDLTQVKDEKQLVPPAKKVKVIIKKAELAVNKTGAWKTLNLQLQIADGIDSTGAYKGKVVFAKPCVEALPDGVDKNGVSYSDCEWYKKNKHLLDIKKFFEALSLSITGCELDDSFCQSLVGQALLVDITQTKGNDTFGPDNEVKNYRELPASSMV
jgi:hypothetical protein